MENHVIAEVRHGFGLAKIQVRRHQAAELEQQFRAHFGIALPRSLRRVSAAGMAVMGVGPGAWLAMHEGSGSAFAVSLKSIIGHAAAICDQSDAYDVLRLTGAEVRRTLCKLVPIDIHERVFKTGDVAETAAAHMGMLLWRLTDDAAGLPVFDVAAARSVSMSFRHAMSVCAAEYGLVWT